MKVTAVISGPQVQMPPLRGAVVLVGNCLYESRDLGIFEVDLATTERLSEEVPEDVTLISESGIRSAADAR